MTQRENPGRIGLILFAVYTAVYSGFVILNAFVPETMSWKPMAGLNLAVVYGMSLIGLAFVLAVFYGWLFWRSGEAEREEAQGRER